MNPSHHATASFLSHQFHSLTFQDLSNYKYDMMVNKSLALLNKFYSSKTKLFKMAVQAMVSFSHNIGKWREHVFTHGPMHCLQVLITTDSCHVHREIARTMPILRRFSKAKLNDDQVKTMGAVLDRYTESVLRLLPSAF